MLQVFTCSLVLFASNGDSQAGASNSLETYMVHVLDSKTYQEWYTQKRKDNNHK